MFNLSNRHISSLFNVKNIVIGMFVLISLPVFSLLRGDFAEPITLSSLLFTILMECNTKFAPYLIAFMYIRYSDFESSKRYFYLYFLTTNLIIFFIYFSIMIYDPFAEAPSALSGVVLFTPYVLLIPIPGLIISGAAYIYMRLQKN